MVLSPKILWTSRIIIGMILTYLAWVDVLEESDQVNLSSFLEALDGRTLERTIFHEVFGYITDYVLVRKFTDNSMCAILVMWHLPKGNRTRAVSVQFLGATTWQNLFWTLLHSFSLPLVLDVSLSFLFGFFSEIIVHASQP